MNVSFEPENLFIKWYEDGTTNVSMNCIDRHLTERGDQTAIIFEGDDPNESKHITYKDLHEHVCRLANVLKSKGVKKGDTVTLYMPMIPEAAYAMLACARIGAVHSVVFGGFSPDSLANRIEGCKSRVVITADEGLRGSKKVPLKANADAAADKAGCVETMIVVKRTGGKVAMTAAATAGTRKRSPRSRAIARRRRWARRTRCSSSSPRGRRAPRRACCTRPAAISSTPR